MYDQYEDQETDELAYGRCSSCGQIEELNADNECLVCEGITRKEHKASSNGTWTSAE